METIQEADGFYTLDCCNQKAHLTCLLDWYNKSRNTKCPLCQQECSLYTDAADATYINIPDSEESSIIDETEERGEILRPERHVGIISLGACSSLIFVYLVLVSSVQNYGWHRVYTL